MKKVELTEDVRQDINITQDAPAYLVFSANGTFEERLFHEFQDAAGFAIECMEASGEDAWDVFPLWAGNALEVT